MSYKSYKKQVEEHLMFLQTQGFAISELQVNADFVRAPQIDRNQVRGELVYKTTCRKLDNGLTGLQTWYRGPGGISNRFMTYGMGPCEDEKIKFESAIVVSNMHKQQEAQQHEIAARKAYGFWNYSATLGRSVYLEKKGVGSYGVRFRSDDKFGNVAIIPMVDESGRIWSYQILNENGDKRQPKGTRADGLFHMIGKALNGSPIGIAESYVSAASCFELTGITTACAFSCQNLKNITVILQRRYPESRLIVFADNDRHLEMRGAANQGIIKGREAVFSIGRNVALVAPDFGDAEACKDLTDWNDLIHYKGFEYAKAQIAEQLRKRS